MIITLNNGTVPIKPIKEREVTAKITGALATIAQKTDVVEGELALNSIIDLGTGQSTPNSVYMAGTKVYLMPDAAFQTWNKIVYELEGVKFVRAPLSAIMAISISDGGH